VHGTPSIAAGDTNDRRGRLPANMNRGGLAMVATRSTRRRPEPLTAKEVAQGLKTIAYWNGVMADLVSQPEVRLCMLGNIGDFAKGNVGPWPPVAEQQACRVRAPIPSGPFALGEVGEVLYALRDCTASIAAVMGRLPRGMDLTAPPKPGPGVVKRAAVRKRAPGKRASAKRAPGKRASAKRAPAKRAKRSK
jgi:hypothetical protein